MKMIAKLGAGVRNKTEPLIHEGHEGHEEGALTFFVILVSFVEPFFFRSPQP
jgi:hypothetical protein